MAEDLRVGEALVVVIDDLRSLPAADVHLRTSAEAVAFLNALVPGQRIAQLWFDHDLGLNPDGSVDSTMPVADVLVEAAFHGHPFPVDRVLVHSANVVGAAQLVRYLARWYRTDRADAPSAGMYV